MSDYEKYMWAWRRLKNNLDYIEEPTPSGVDDFASLEAVVNGINTDRVFRGDGKYSRFVNYLDAICDTVDFIKKYWRGDDKTLTAFLLGIDCAVFAIRRQARLIDTRAYRHSINDWRRP